MATPTVDELRELFQKRAPRSVPEHVLLRALKVFSGPKAVVNVGVGLCVVGVTFLALLPFRSLQPNADKLSGRTSHIAAIAILFVVVGFTLAYRAWRRRKQMNQPLPVPSKE